MGRPFRAEILIGQERKALTAAIRLSILANLANLVDLVARSALAHVGVNQTMATISLTVAHTLTHWLGHLIGSLTHLQKTVSRTHAETLVSKLPISTRLLGINLIRPIHLTCQRLNRMKKNLLGLRLARTSLNRSFRLFFKLIVHIIQFTLINRPTMCGVLI